MIVLGIDTSTARTSVAVVDGARVVETMGSDGARGVDLLVFVDRACREAGVTAHPVDHTALPFGSAAGRGHAATIDHTALPFGSAAGRGHAATIDHTALPFGSAAGRGHAATIDHTALPFGSAAGRGHAATIDHTALPLGSAAGRGHAATIDDTALPLGSAAGRGHAATIDAVAIGAGPGSFTGLRIGMASAKGIAFAAARPLWAVSSLAALAWGADSDDIVCAALDARRGEIYAGCYQRDRVVAEDRVIAPGELAAWAESHGARRFTGDALAAYPDALAPLATGWRGATPTGRAVAELAMRGPRVDIVVDGAPAYLRRAEAEVLYPDGVPGALRRH